MTDANTTKSILFSAKPEIHAVIGAGQVGTKLARLLAARGHRVRLARRSAPGATLRGVTWYRGDITDASFADEVCRGADVVYHCANPAAYHRWPELLTPLFDAILGAASRAGAKLVVLDNVYMYGPDKKPLTEASALNATTVKGGLRASLATKLFEAHARGDVRATSGRASDYFGPATPNASIFNDRFWSRLLAGKSVDVFGNPDLLHSYSYTPDVARGLMTLGEHSEALGSAWHLPVAHQGSTRDLIAACAAAAGCSTPKINTIPRWLLRSVGWVNGPARALVEMLYQFEQNFVVDDRRFVETFGETATPVEDAVMAVVGNRRAA